MEVPAPKILFCATVMYHIKTFHIPSLKMLKDEGYEIHVAANSVEGFHLPFVDKVHQIDIARKPFQINNLKAYFQLQKIIEKENYDLIHFHVPVSAAIGRMAARNARKKGTLVFYTAHGFNFFKGSSLLSWLIYFPIEKYLSKYTDCLITINQEDYNHAKNYNFNAGTIEKINGMGVNLTKFHKPNKQDKQDLRIKHGFKVDDFILIYSGEFSIRKNQEWLIKIMPDLQKLIPNIKLLLPGEGNKQADCIKLAENLSVQDIIFMPGFRKDIEELIKLSDIGVSASKNEGLGIHLIEDMACGKPIIATDIQGHKDLIKDGCNGFLIDIKNPNEIIQHLIKLNNDRVFYEQLSEESLKISKEFSMDTSINQIETIYNLHLFSKGVKRNSEIVT